MLIDWFTTAAQVVNFLILVALLKRFLYGPIIRAMDAREERIRERLEDAERERAEAAREKDGYREKSEKLDREREGILASARKEAEATRGELVDGARDEVEEMRRKWRESVEQERENFVGELERRTVRQVFEVAGRALGDLADSNLERVMAGVFARRVRALASSEPEALEGLGRNVASGEAAVVSSAFELPEDARNEIAGAVREAVGGEARVEFRVEPDLVSGIELASGGVVTAWSLGDYVAELAEETEKALAGEAAGSKG